MSAALGKVRGMTVGRKFLLIALVSLVPLAFSTGLWLQEIHSRVASLESERAGLATHRELRRLLSVMAEHREAVARGGLDPAKGQPAAAQLGVLRKMIAEIGPSITRGRKDEEAVRLLGAISGHLESAARSAATSAEDAWAEHGDAMARLVALMAHVASTAGIVVDNDPSTFYLSRIVAERSPALVARLAEARSLAPILVANGTATPAQVDRLRAIAILAQADLQAIGAHGRDLARVNPALAERANKPLPEVIAAGTGFVRSIESLTRSARESTKGWEWVYESDQSIAKILQSSDRIHHELTALLDARVDELAQRRNLLVGLNLGVIGIAALFAFLLMRSVRASITRALEVAHRVAHGDLSNRVADVKGTDESARLMQSLQQMTLGLAQMVGQVRTSSEKIGSDVRSLAEGNRDLSIRTESQASAIEEAAASMEQITASVRQNQDTAKETKRIASLAADSTTRGIQAATRVVENMDSIRDSTKRVGEIVGMIDAIAFQTNILALNAAVEAARAGEHGRGFAVVAAEVRNLAKRCADSAREIKGLVRGATDQVTGGAKLVDEVAEAIGDINTRVIEVGELMNRIVAASQEQGAGINQVGETITHMERVTQQNAALVEEIVAATESLSQQTSRLGALVGVFRLEGATASPRKRVSSQEAALALPDR